MSMFTPKQKEIIARKIGYEGPMQGFDEFLNSSPSLQMKYNGIVGAYEKKKFNTGGSVSKTYADFQNQFGKQDIVGQIKQYPALAESTYKSLASMGYGSDVIDQIKAQVAGVPKDGSVVPEVFGENSPVSTTPKSSTSEAVQTMTTAMSSSKQQITDLYKKYLKRDPDAAGLAFYEDFVAKGGKMSDVEADIMKSPEATGGATPAPTPAPTPSPDRKAAIEALYSRYLNRTPDAAGLEFYMNPQFSMELIESDIARSPEARKKSEEAFAKEFNTATSKGGVFASSNPAQEYDDTGRPVMGDATKTSAQTTGVAGLTLNAPVYAADGTPRANLATAGQAAKADVDSSVTPSSYDASTASSKVKTATDALTAETGRVTAPMKAAQGTLSTGAMATAAPAAQAAKVSPLTGMDVTADMLAKAASVADVGGVPSATAQTTDKKFTAEAATLPSATPQATAATNYALDRAKSATMTAPAVESAAKAASIPQATAVQSGMQSTVTGQTRDVTSSELVDVTKQGLQINEPVQAIAAVSQKLDNSAIAIAQQGNFSQALATAAQDRVEAASTVQGQLSSLMSQFNDGTPAWAAGAIRSANAAMAARGLAGSSMAGAAIVQAAMEAATPIAAADAQVFAQMQLTNLNNRQQVALANAAAAQNLELANLSARQQAALQNSANAFSLQSQNLSNQQAVVLANAQLKAAAMEKNLDVKTQVALTNAARYAEVNNINLNNRQQAALQRSAENLQIEMANLNAAQQTSLSNLQVRAAIAGQELSNEQQMAVLRSTQLFEAAQFNATSQQQAFIADFQARAALEGQVLANRQQTSLFNVSNIVAERNLTFTADQQTRLFNTTNALQIETANLSNRQQTALANAQIDAALRGQELSNKQQTNIVNAARVAEIAQVNFTAEQQNALANAQFIQQINLQDMSNKQATVLANAATIASMDMANLNARQQAAVQNAQAFLQMDMANLSNEQQTALFKTQSIIQAALSDTAAENAARQFNAANEQQAEQFTASLSSQVSQFNAAQQNAMKQFDVTQENAVAQFNAQMQAQRQEFNARNRIVIDQANAQLLAQVSLANTAAVNAANFQNAQAMNNMTLAQYNNEVQLYRDQVKMVYDSYERAEDRAASMATAMLQADLTREKMDVETSASYGKLLGSVLTGTNLGNELVKLGGSFIKNLFGG